VGNVCDIAIVGAGAAGLAAGIFAAETALTAGYRLRIVLLDSAKKVGAKILISGGGRCNVTHAEIHPEDFNGSRNIVRNILAAFNEQATMRWFDALGVPLKCEETGKLFPISDNARTVLDALLQRCAELGVTILTQHRVHSLEPTEVRSGQDTAFIVRHEQGMLSARCVIMATGGRSLPRTGSDGAGWDIVRRLGHTVTETYPALVPLVLREGMFHAQLSGLSLPVELSTFADGKLIDRRTGSLLWTHFGISGPVVMDASRHWIIARASGQSVAMQCNFLPGQNFSGGLFALNTWKRQPLEQRPDVV
jgi:predicted Rossmann fold flavoprotein